MMYHQYNHKKRFVLKLLIILFLSLTLFMCVVKVKVVSAKSMINSFSCALTNFYLDTGRYPTSEESLNALINRPESISADKWNGPYLTGNLPKDRWGNQYIYKFPGLHNNIYDLYSMGPDGTTKADGEDKDDINNWRNDEDPNIADIEITDSIVFVVIFLLIIISVILLGSKIRFFITHFLKRKNK